MAAATGGGALAALSLPPWGWWPLGFAGTALLAWCVRQLPLGRRLAAGLLFGLGLFAVGLWWMGEFHAVGAAAVVVGEAAFLALAAAAAPPGRWALLGLPGAMVLAEAARGAVPFGGVPIAGLGLGQAGGPLAGAARLGGELLVVGLAWAGGASLAAAVSRRWIAAGSSLAVVVGGAVLGAFSPDGAGGRSLDVALVQGGGRRGYRAVESGPQPVLAAHLAASRRLEPPLDLVVWPEDVVDVDGALAGSPEEEALADVARDSRSTVVAGVTEGAGRRFRNAAVAWSPAGEVVARYEKVKRVPFGEYVPGRALVERLADVSAVPRDAVPGRGAGLLRTPAADVGVAISYEVFFRERARAATRGGGRLLAVPTNTASYSSTQVPTQEVAAARLRAIESGRDLVQAAPTGYGLVVDHHGRVRARTSLGRRQVVHRRLTLREGRTPYVRAGDGPVVGLAALTLALAWLGRRRPSARTLPG